MKIFVAGHWCRRRAVPALIERGHDVTALVRSPDAAEVGAWRAEPVDARIDGVAAEAA